MCVGGGILGEGVNIPGHFVTTNGATKIREVLIIHKFDHATVIVLVCNPYCHKSMLKYLVEKGGEPGFMFYLKLGSREPIVDLPY